MHSMPSFVHHGHEVSRCANRIHENEWNTNFVQWVVVTSGSFAILRFQIEVAHFVHHLKAVAEIMIYVIKNHSSFINQFFTAIKGLEWRFAFRINCQIIGLERLDSHSTLSIVQDLVGYRAKDFSHTFVEIKTVFFAIVKASHGFELIITEILKSCVYSNLMALAHKL